MMDINPCKLVRNHTRLILSDGSERGEYVPMPEVFSRFHKIHDGIQLMKTYYPNDPLWQTHDRISKRTKLKNVSYAWDYEYDDYHPLDIFEPKSKTLKQMEEIKTYGSDIYLTLTMDINLQENAIKKIFEKLNGFGRIYFRINHEENGSWFRHNKDGSPLQQAKFFVKCHNIAKSVSPQFKTVFSITSDMDSKSESVSPSSLKLSKGQLNKALKYADFWSIDKYLSLHYGWPFEHPGKNGFSEYFSMTPDKWWSFIDESYIQMILNAKGAAKPLFINEFNDDSDVNGYENQAENIKKIYSKIAEGNLNWLAGITLYQFRDRGGLGLETEKAGNAFTPLPALSAYKSAINSFKDTIEFIHLYSGDGRFEFRWDNSDSIIGLHADGFSGEKRIINTTKVPIFVYLNTDDIWYHLNPGQFINIDRCECCFFIPPFLSNFGEIKYMYTIYSAKDWVQSLICNQ